MEQNIINLEEIIHAQYVPIIKIIIGYLVFVIIAKIFTFKNTPIKSFITFLRVVFYGFFIFYVLFVDLETGKFSVTSIPSHISAVKIIFLPVLLFELITNIIDLAIGPIDRIKRKK